MPFMLLFVIVRFEGDAITLPTAAELAKKAIAAKHVYLERSDDPRDRAAMNVREIYD